MKILIVVLTLLSLGLGAAMLFEHQHATQAIKAAQDGLLTVSNSWEQTKVKLDESQKVTAALETTLSNRIEALTVTSNDLAKAIAGLVKTSSDLAKTQSDFEAAQAEVKKQQAQIAQLETQRDDLTKKMDDLTNSISALEVKITDTQKKLAASDGDRSFLLKELQRLQGEKATLMSQFNNLAVLRAQVAKLKEEAAVNQRLAWMQMGVYNQRDKKGAERLLATTPPVAKPDNRLELELHQNGHGNVVPATTNASPSP